MNLDHLEKVFLRSLTESIGIRSLDEIVPYLKYPNDLASAPIIEDFKIDASFSCSVYVRSSGTPLAVDFLGLNPCYPDSSGTTIAEWTIASQPRLH